MEKPSQQMLTDAPQGRKRFSSEELFAYWRRRVFLAVWITYGTFYLCRVSISVAIPGIMKEFGYSKTMMGTVLTSLFITYAVGQFINGQLGDKVGARRLISLGLLASGILNILFGFSRGIGAMMLVWGLNGYCQSMGWAPTVKTVANWFPPERRGKMSGLLGTSYQIGNAYSWALAGLVVGLWGWRWAFWIPAGIVILSAFHWYTRGRNAPEEIGLPTIEEEARSTSATSRIRKDHHIGFGHTLRLVLMTPRIWYVALGLFCLNIVRYGFIGWAATYMFEVQKAAISTAAYKTIAIPLAGSLGAIVAGWMSDRFFQSRRAPVATIMLLILGASAWLYPRVPAGNWVLSLCCLLVIGFMTYGPHVLIVGALPMDLCTRKACSSGAGFVDCLGYVGASLTGVGSGWLADKYGWNAAFHFWVVAAAVAAVLMGFLWSYKPREREYL